MVTLSLDQEVGGKKKSGRSKNPVHGGWSFIQLLLSEIKRGQLSRVMCLAQRLPRQPVLPPAYAARLEHPQSSRMRAEIIDLSNHLPETHIWFRF